MKRNLHSVKRVRRSGIRERVGEGYRMDMGRMDGGAQRL
jgi:hypothetical protein